MATPRKKTTKPTRKKAEAAPEPEVGHDPQMTEIAVSFIRAERLRQVAVEGYDPAHDGEHIKGELALAAAAYAIPPQSRDRQPRWVRTPKPVLTDAPVCWPFSIDSWKPCPEDRLNELVKAGALILAEIERIAGPQIRGT